MLILFYLKQLLSYIEENRVLADWWCSLMDRNVEMVNWVWEWWFHLGILRITSAGVSIVTAEIVAIL
jgi:hypothetical protein